MEHTQILATDDVLSLEHRGLARRDLRHANGDDAHEADLGVVSLDEDQLACGGVGEKTKGLQVRWRWRLGLGLVGGFVDGISDGRRRLGEVRAGNIDDLSDGAFDGSVPAVITCSVQEALQDRAPDEVFDVVAGKEVLKGVSLVLDEELVVLLDVLLVGV